MKADRAKTFILKWNPGISSVDLNDWDFWVKKQRFLDCNWSIHDYEHVSPGDGWYMLRVGEGTTGIVGHGTFIGRPYPGDDWAGSGRTKFYCDLHLSHLVSHSAPMIPTEVLEQEIPGFDWRGGHSGVMIEGDGESRLAELVDDYYKERGDVAGESDVFIEHGVEEEIVGWDNFANLFKKESQEDSYYAWSERAFHDMATLKTEHDYWDSTFTFTVVLRREYVLPIVCRELKRIKANLNGYECYESCCKIWHDGYHFHVNVNEVEVICEDLEFGAVTAYGKDSICLKI